MNSPAQELRIIPLGGLGEIGMNCTAFEWGDEIVIVDCGLLFSDLEHFGVEFVIPDFTYLKERAEKVKGIVITHGHEDHIGGIPFLLKAGIQAPVHASHFTSLLIRERMKEHESVNADVRVYDDSSTIQIGSFTVRPFAVNHSIVDAHGLILETPVGKIIHTGDFKIDPTPHFGKMMDLEVLRKAGDEGVLLLMSDSTNIERQEVSMSEKIIMAKFEEIFKKAQGLTIVSMFSSNVGRMGQVFDIARKLGKRVALSGRSMEQNVRLGREAGYLKNLEPLLISLDDIEKFPRSEVIVLSTGSQGESRSALIRVAVGEHKQIQLGAGDVVVMSSKFIPGNEKAIGRMINHLFRQGAEVYYEAVHDIHVSGHASRAELKQILELVRPKFFMPVHGEYRHLVHHAGLGREVGIPPENVVIAENGAVLSLTPNSFGHVDRLETERILVESRDGVDISKVVLKDRRQMAETGIVFAMLVRKADSRTIIAGPEIFTKGIASEDMESWLVDDAKEIARKVIDSYENKPANAPDFDLAEEVRIHLRRFFKQNCGGKKPVVLPIVLDL